MGDPFASIKEMMAAFEKAAEPAKRLAQALQPTSRLADSLQKALETPPIKVPNIGQPTVLIHVPPDGVKILRETLCVAQALIGQSDDARKAEHSGRLQSLIAECDRHRPLGPDGKHGERHTPTCGCEDR